MSPAVNWKMRGTRIISQMEIQHLNTQNTNTSWKRHEAGSRACRFSSKKHLGRGGGCRHYGWIMTLHMCLAPVLPWDMG